MIVGKIQKQILGYLSKEKGRGGGGYLLARATSEIYSANKFCGRGQKTVDKLIILSRDRHHGLRLGRCMPTGKGRNRVFFVERA